MSTLSKIAVVIGVAFAIAADIYAPGWGQPVLLVGSVSLGSISILRRLWRYWWFWATEATVVALHLAALALYPQLRVGLEEMPTVTFFLVALGEFVVIVLILLQVGRQQHVPEDELKNMAN